MSFLYADKIKLANSKSYLTINCSYFVLDETFSKINAVISKIKGDNFSDTEIEAISFELRSVLLGADIPYRYVKALVADMQQKLKRIKEKKIDKNAVIGGLLQSYIDTTFCNTNVNGVTIKNNGITTIGIFGSNGVGKTSFIAKLANLLHKSHNKRVMCVSFDVTRFAAQEQLKILCEKNDIEFLDIVHEGIDKGIDKINEIIAYEMVDILLIDNAGASPDGKDSIELWQKILQNINFDEKIIVLDGTIGQNAVSLIEKFDKVVNATGFAISKVDSDQKGGVFFSVATASNKPIYYVSTGEKITNITPFNKHMISDALFSDGRLKNIIASFHANNKEYIDTVISKSRQGELNYNDLLEQLTQLVSFGKLDKILSILPHTKNFFNVKLSTDAYILIKKWIAIIMSMTLYERDNIHALNIDRMNRIAKGAGVNISDVVTLKRKVEEINQQK